MQEVISETPVEETTPVEQVEQVEEKPALVETPQVVEEEKTYVYQPKDDNGRPIGGKQVIKYRSQEELIQKMEEQNVLLIRKLREQTRKARLGIVEQDEIPEDAPKTETRLAFTPRVLSEEERVMISRDLLDPERFDDASDRLFEAKLGANPQKLLNVVTNLQDDVEMLRAKAEVDAFLAANPKYYRCAENQQAIVNWMMRYNLALVRENFQRAHDALQRDKLLVTLEPESEVESEQPPTPPEVSVPVAEVQSEPVVENPPPSPRRAGLSTGLTKDISQNTGPAPAPVGSDITYEINVGKEKRVLYGKQAIEAMPSEEYKRRLKTDPSFAQKVEKIENESAGRRSR